MGTPISPLEEKDRKRLDSIVDQMILNKESEENIRFVVDDFKQKYGQKKSQVGNVSANGSPISVSPYGVTQGNFSVNDVSRKPIDQSDTDELPSTSTVKLGATDARIGGDKYFNNQDIGKALKSIGKGAALGVGTGLANIPKGIAIAAKELDFFNEYEGKKAEDLATYKAGKWIENTTKDLVGDLTPEEQQNFGVQLAQGFGNMATLAAGGIGARALGASELLTTAAIGAAQQGSSEYENAVAAGATPEQAAKVFWINTAIGTTDSWPMMGAFRKLDKYTGGLATGALAKKLSSTVAGRISNEIAQGFIKEAAQEAGQQFLTNLTAKNIYDKTRSLFEGVPSSGLIGGIIGGTMTGITSGIREKRLSGNLTAEENEQLDKTEEFANQKIQEVSEQENKDILNQPQKIHEPQETGISPTPQEKIEPQEIEKVTPSEKVGNDIWKLTKDESFKKYEDKDIGEGVDSFDQMTEKFLDSYEKGKSGLSIEGNSVVYRNENGIPIGFIHFDKSGAREMGVAKSERGKGIASKMVDYLKQEKGIDKLLPPFSKEGNQISHRNEVKKAIAEGKYQEAVSKGEMTEERADEIIKSAGLKPQEKVSRDISGEEKVEKPSQEQQLKDIQNGEIVTFTYKNEKDVPEIFKDKISSRGEKNGEPFIRVTIAKSLADYELSRAQQSGGRNTEGVGGITGENVKQPQQQSPQEQPKGEPSTVTEPKTEKRVEAEQEKVDYNKMNDLVKSGELIVDDSGITKTYAWHSKDGRLNVTTTDKKGIGGHVYQLYSIKVDGKEIATTKEYSKALQYTKDFFEPTEQKTEAKTEQRVEEETKLPDQEKINQGTKEGERNKKIAEDLYKNASKEEKAAMDKRVESGVAKKLSDAVLKLKIDLSNGGLQSNVLGLPIAVWNTAMDIVSSTIKAGGTVADAIKRGLNHIQKNHRGQWDKKAFNDQVLKELGVRGITINGEDLIVKEQTKEFAETVNGWYSDLEQSVLDIKGEQGSGESWKKVLGNSDEAKWTGLNDWLSQQKGQVTKKQIQDFLKENRIQVVEVVKSGNVKDSEGEWQQVSVDEDLTKFSQYQLEGQKENYKEVLVTLPKESQAFKKAAEESFSKKKEVDEYVKTKVPRKSGEDIVEYFDRANKALESDEKYQQLRKEQDVLRERYYELSDKQKASEEKEFRSSHFDEPNILVHLRMNTRIDADGNKVLFLEEVQSDWGQKGKKEGFATADEKLNAKMVGKDGYWEITGNDGRFVTNVMPHEASSEAEAIKVAQQRIKNDDSFRMRKGTPQAPFVTETPSWTKLGLKVALKEAVKQGADKIAWTTGEQQNDRYDLSKQVDEITIIKTSDDSYDILAVQHGNIRTDKVAENIPKEKIPDYVGKELADKYIQSGKYVEVYKGNDLKVGGKGMKGFYGSPSENKLGIVGEVAKSLFKQEPKKVSLFKEQKWPIYETNNGQYKIEGEDAVVFSSKDEAKQFIKDNKYAYPTSKIEQHSITITPELKREAESGLPLFKDIKGRGKEIADLLRKGKIKQGGLQSNIAGIPIAIYNAAIETIATALEKGASLTQAIQKAIKNHKLKDQKDFNQKEFISKLEEATGEKFEEKVGKPPTEPPSGEPPVEESAVSGEESDLPERRFTKQMLRDDELLPEAKEEIAKTLNYVRQTKEMSVKEAGDILNKLGVDEAQNAVMNDKELKPAVRVTLAQVVIRKYNELAKNATTEGEKNFYLDKTIQTATFVTETLATEPGRMIQAFSIWSRLSPEGQLRAANQDMAKQAKEKMNRRKKDVDVISDKFKKANEEAAEEATKDKDVQEESKKDDNEKIAKAKDKISKAKEKRANIIKKYKDNKGKGGKLFSSPLGLTPEGIEFVGDIAKTYIEEGVANLEILAQKILIHLEEVAGKKPNDEIKKQVGEIADKEFDKADKSFLGKTLKDKGLQINKIVKEHYTVVDKVKKNLAQKFMDEAGMEQSNAKELAAKVEAAFDRIATRKKRNILYHEKARFDKIQKTFQTDKKAEPKTIQSEIIKFSNLGAFENTDMLDMLADRFGLKQLTPAQAAKLLELAERVQKAPEGSPKNSATEDLLAYRANIKGNDWGETAQAVWYANILSGYRTHEKNVVSTFFNAWGEMGAEMLKDPKAIPYIIGGYIKGVSKRGLVEARHTLLTGRSPIHIKKIETPTTLERKPFVGGGWNPANWFKYVTRLMVAEDVLTFQGLKEARAYQLARREAAKEGVNTWTKKGWNMVNEKLFHTQERWLIAQDQAETEGFKPKTLEWRRRIYELMEDSRPEKMTEDAYGFAAHGTFNYESVGTLGAFTNAVAKALDVDVAGVKPARFIVPFTRIITNVVNNSLDFTPVGLVRAARGVRGFKGFEEGQYTKGAFKELTREERQRLVAKAMTGIAMAATLQAMHLAGVLTITGGGPDDKKKKQQLKEQGWEEYSIKIGDRWISYKYTPLVFMLGWMGNWNDASKYNDEDEQTTAKKAQMAFLRMGNQVVDMTWINSAGTFLGALADGTPNEQGKKVNDALAGMSRGFIPFSQAITQTTTLYESAFNQPAKQVNGSWQALIQDIPVVRNSLNDKINALGEPVKKDIDVFYSNVNPSPIWKFLDEKQGWVATLSKPSVMVFDQKSKQDRPVTDDEFYELSKLRGSKIKEDLQKLMNSGFPVIRNGISITVSKENIKSKELNEVLSKIETQATKEAKEELFGEKTTDKKEQGVRRKWNDKINSIILKK